MHDILNDRTSEWQYLESTLQSILKRYGYQEIRTPVLEKTALFERSIGETSDIVSKEMYTFKDLGGDSLTMRPEGTASVVRAVLQHTLYRGNALRLWYCGPMFRHERPQKGRLRQFHQVGAEAIGLPGPDIDAEIIALCARFWKDLGISGLALQLNTLGSSAARQHYRDLLVEYFNDHRQDLDRDSLTRLESNPLRILDSKNPDMQSLIEGAPDMSESMDEASLEHFQGVQAQLQNIGIEYSLNPRLVRGLDYYSHTVFEWVSDRLGAQATVCAGGRYDGLLEHFGSKPVPGIGFAMGLERILELLQVNESITRGQLPHVYLIIAGESCEAEGFRLAEMLRDRLSGLRLLMHCGGGSFKSQFKKADRSEADIALILGEDELAGKRVGMKFLRREGEQQDVKWTELADRISAELDLANPAQADFRA